MRKKPQFFMAHFHGQRKSFQYMYVACCTFIQGLCVFDVRFVLLCSCATFEASFRFSS